MPITNYAQNDWEIIIPLATTNMVSNSSIELDTTGYTVVSSATIARVSTFQYWGVYSLAVTPASGTTSGVFYGTISLVSGTTYTASVYFLGTAGLTYTIYFASTAAAELGTSTDFTATGQWQRVEVTYTEVSSTTRRIYITKAAGANLTVYYIDGLQVEAQSEASTYCDGDQPGCFWNGVEHNATSTRDGQSRAGGQIINLRDDYSLLIRQQPGTGMPPLRNIQNDLGLQDGAEFQRTLAGVRSFTLTGVIQSASSIARFHNLRKTIIDSIKPDKVAEQQALLLRYTGASNGTKQIKVHYDSGLELGGDVESGIEYVDLRFVAYDPFWEDEGDQGTSLSPNTVVASVSNLLYRSACGEWSKVGGTGIASGVRTVIKGACGIWYIGHGANGVGASQSYSVAQYNPATDFLTNMASGVVEANLAGASAGPAVIDCMSIAPNGNLFIAGGFQLIKGSTNTIACRIAEWDGTSWHRVREPSSGCPGFDTGNAQALVFDTYGQMHAAGSMQTAGSMAACGIAIWDLSACRWSTPASRGISTTTGHRILDAVLGLDGKVYYGGTFTSVGGSTYVRFAAFDPTASAWAGSSASLANDIKNMTVGLDGTIYAAGSGNIISSGSDQQIAFNGVDWRGIGQTNTAAAYITGLRIGKKTGYMYGFPIAATSIDGNILPDNYTPARRNSTTWTALDVAFSNDVVQTQKGIYEDEQGNLMLGFGMTLGTAAASVSSFQVVSNSGTSESEPVIIVKGKGTLFQITNYTTSQTLYFNAYPVQSGETITIDFNANKITSTFLGNITPRILPGSNFANWRLLSGNNNIGVFMTNVTTASVNMQWRKKHWSIDG